MLSLLKTLRALASPAGVAALFLAALVSPQPLQAAPAVPLHTAGPYIVDSNGYRVRLNAVNWYGAEGKDFVVMGLDKQPIATIASEIKSRGFNAVRLPWSNQMYESNPVVGTYALTANPSLEGENAMTIYDAVVNALTNAGLMVILDNHTSTAMWCCGNTDVNAVWFNSTYPQTSWIADWQGMAARYANNPMVIGADLRNEPRGSAVWGGGGQYDWHAAATTAGNDVLASNPNLLIFVEGISFAGDLSGVANTPVTLNTGNHLVYEAHDYGFWYSGGVASYSAWYSKINPKWGYLVTGNSPAPLWIGEFGTCNTSTSCINTTSTQSDLGNWFSYIHQFLWEYSVDWSYWAINGTTETGNGNGFDSTETYGILNSSWDGDALSGLTSNLQSLINSGGGPATTTYEITNANSGLAMEVYNWSTANGGIVDQWTFSGSQKNQEWTLTYLNNGLYQLTNVNSGDVLDAVNRGTSYGTKLQQWSNLSGSNQEYVITHTPDGYFRFINSASGLAVEVPSFSTSNGTQLDIWGWNGGSNQKWTMTAK